MGSSDSDHDVVFVFGVCCFPGCDSGKVSEIVAIGVCIVFVVVIDDGASDRDDIVSRWNGFGLGGKIMDSCMIPFISLANGGGMKRLGDRRNSKPQRRGGVAIDGSNGGDDERRVPAAGRNRPLMASAVLNSFCPEHDFHYAGVNSQWSRSVKN